MLEYGPNVRSKADRSQLSLKHVIKNAKWKNNKKLISGDEIANVNFLYDDIVHALQNIIDWYINSATDRRGHDAG